MATVENLTGVGLVDTEKNPGTIILPLTINAPNRQLIFKDIYGNLANNFLYLETQGDDLFEDGKPTKVLDNSFGSITLFAEKNVWYVTGGTNQVDMTILSLTVSSINFGEVVNSENLISTTFGIDESLISTNFSFSNQLISTTFGLVEVPDLVSTTFGINTSLLSTNFSFSNQLVSTTFGLVEVPELVSTTFSLLNQSGGVSATQLISTTFGLVEVPELVSTTFSLLNQSGGVSATQLISTTFGLVEVPELVSTTNKILIDMISTGARYNLSFSTQQIFMSSTRGQAIITSSLNVNSLTIGTGTGWVNIGPIQTVAISSVQTNTRTSYSDIAYISSVYIGSTFSSAPGYAAFVNGPARINQLLLGNPSTNQFQQPAFDLQVIRANQAVKAAGGVWATGSDERIKTAIRDANLDLCYENVRNLPLRRFAWTSNYLDYVNGIDRHVLGFIAQEVSTIMPKSVIQSDYFGISNFHFLDADQINMTLYGSVKRIIRDKEHLESTVKGQRFELETLEGKMSFVLSTLEGLQGR